MHREKLGALIDGIYAIALTILVLDLPKPETTENLIDLIPKIQYSFIDYVLSFFLLFAFWYNQRRINELTEHLNRFTLWLNGFMLLFICLIPYSMVVLHRYGDNEYVDILYVANWLIIDMLMHIILRLHGKERYKNKEELKVIRDLFLSRQIVTIFTVVILILAVLSPVPNRYALLFVPLLLIFEKEIVWLNRTIFLLIKREN
jgi:uncharacterized membrane protein